jgi:TolB protein
MIARLFAAAFATALLSAAATPVSAQIEFDVTQGQVRATPVAVAPFDGPDGQPGAVGADLARVISANLERSGFFQPLAPSALPNSDLDVGAAPDFGVWRQTNAQALVHGRVTTDADGRMRVDFRLWDPFQEREIGEGMQFTVTPEAWRRVAHKISDVVYERLTGEKGWFDTRIVFVAESGPKSKRVKRLAIMDQDGANPSYLTNGREQVLTPRFSSTDQEITYMVLADDYTRLYLFNIQTGRQETLGQFDGVVLAPRFSPDGNKVAFSVERRGNIDVYVMDLRSRTTQRLTTDPGIDTSPSFSPDGRQIVFNSDRGGSPQLYVMNADGTGVRRISHGSGRYSTPVWSPRGDLIAFTKQGGGGFSIGVMSPGGGGERSLTSSYFEEGPTWAPNGRYLMFFRETPGGQARLWMTDVTGRILRPAPYEGSASDPAWSPLLP